VTGDAVRIKKNLDCIGQDMFGGNHESGTKSPMAVYCDYDLTDGFVGGD